MPTHLLSADSLYIVIAFVLVIVLEQRCKANLREWQVRSAASVHPRSKEFWGILLSHLESYHYCSGRVWPPPGSEAPESQYWPSMIAFRIRQLEASMNRGGELVGLRVEQLLSDVYGVLLFRLFASTDYGRSVVEDINMMQVFERWWQGEMPSHAVDVLREAKTLVPKTDEE